MNTAIDNIQKNIEETIKKIGMTTYGGVDFEPSAEYKKELTKILQSLLDEQKKEIVERIKEEIDLLGEPNDILHEDLNNILNKII